jgi:molecular chaperone DnaJ
VAKDLYAVLEIDRKATPDEIKRAFRRLAKVHHPDRNRDDPSAAHRFKEIQQAYAVLSDPNKRAEYDARGFAGVAGFSPEDLFGGIDFGDLFQGFGFDVGLGQEGLFDRLFRRRRIGPARGMDLDISLEVPLERVVSGGDEAVRFTRPESCTACQGSGAKAGTAPRRCDSCGGTGQRVVGERRAGISFQQISPCPVCGARGQIIDEPCPACGGRGTVQRQEELTVKIPVGVEEGMVLRIPGRGLPSEEPGGRPGDLLVVVHSRPDPRFERRGAELWRLETIPVPDAVLGATRQVPTLEGNAVVTIPPGIQPDTVLRLRGKGLPVFEGRQRGDLNIVVRVWIPDRLSAQERKLYARLRALGGTGEVGSLTTEGG